MKNILYTIAKVRKKSRKREEKAAKVGLSNEQQCVLTAVQRYGDAVAQTFIMAKPKSSDSIFFRQITRDDIFQLDF